jgi:hypothetical protein
VVPQGNAPRRDGGALKVVAVSRLAEALEAALGKDGGG